MMVKVLEAEATAITASIFHPAHHSGLRTFPLAATRGGVSRFQTNGRSAIASEDEVITVVVHATAVAAAMVGNLTDPRSGPLKGRHQHKGRSLKELPQTWCRAEFCYRISTNS